MEILNIKNMHLISMMIFLGLGVQTIWAGDEAEQNDIETKVAQMFSQIRSNKPLTVSLDNAEKKKVDPTKLLKMYSSYEKDESLRVRLHVYGFMRSLADMHPTFNEVRQEVTRKYVTAVTTGELGLPVDWLLTCTASDFSNETKDILRQTLEKGVDGDIILVAGVADMQDQKEKFKKLLIDEVELKKQGKSIWKKDGWKVRLALARMGSQEDVKKCIDLVESEKDDTYRVLHLLPQIGYIRQPEAIEYLKRYLNSEERLPEVGSYLPGTKRMKRGSSYASYVLDILARSLKNFPIQARDGRGYKPEEIKTAREWMAKQTKWEIIR